MRQFRRHARKGALFSLLLTAALFMRVFVPTGWMPVVDASGFHFEICPGWSVQLSPEPAAQHHAAHGGHHAHAAKDTPDKHDRKTHSDQPCAFAGLAMAWVEVAAAPSIDPLPVRAEAPMPLLAAVAGRGLAAPPPPPTGPPGLA